MYKGASCSLLGGTSDLMRAHGADGLGDVPDIEPVDDTCLKSEHAVTFLQESVHSHPGKEHEGMTQQTKDIQPMFCLQH